MVPAHAATEPSRTPRAIFLFWLPLALQWIMMALEGPFLAAVIARLADPTFNLAAYGVAFAFAILVESPVIMLMSASTALVEDLASYRKLRAFAAALNVLSTALLVVLLIPPVFDLVLRTGLGLPPQVADLVYGSLWILLPWPAAIGYRRFLHGVMIRAGQTRRVMIGTLVRLGGMALTGLILAGTGIPGAWVGAGALSAGVVIEAVVAGLMSRDAIRRLSGGEGEEGDAHRVDEAIRPGSPAAETAVAAHDAAAPAPEPTLLREAGAATGSVRALGAALRVTGRTQAPPRDGDPELTFAAIARFYYPLALTSLIGLTTQPILTFFMGRAPAPVESLALFPVVMALYFIFGTLGLSYQEAAIALVGRKGEHRREIGRFAAGLAVFASGSLSLIAFTPMARVWFEGVSGLDPAMAALAFAPAQIIAIAPALSVVLGFQRALLVQARRTRPITVATAIEVTAIVLLFPLFGWGLGLMGVTAAMAALVCGRTLGVTFLAWATRARPEAPAAT
jgi:progressive ankylosis protein